MMLGKIGIDFPLLAFQIVNFLLLVWLLNRFLYGPVLETLRKRQHEIEQGLQLKEAMEQKQQSLVKRKAAVLQEAREEAQLLIEKKKEEGRKMRERIIAEARKEKEAIVAQGKKELAARRRQIEREVQAEIVNLAALLAEKALSEIMTANQQHAIIRAALDKLGKIELKQT